MREGKGPTADELAMQRTLMASERTFMAWTRTSLSLISFGFTIYKFLQYARENNPNGPAIQGPRNLGTVLVGMGVLFLILSAIQHWQHMKRASSPILTPRTWSLSMFLALLLAVLGILAMINMIFRVGPF
ncbi:MAG: DUF202 domain-containing protein [Sedimentisphaerales bacterium]|nr:DUF202 domain-containing protein [Sedimentisphaerales bacterium]